MMIKIRSLKTAKNKISGIFHETDKTHEVIAVIMIKKEVFYLMQDDDKWICLINSDNCDVVDDKICDFWVFRRFKYNNVIKNKKYNFKLIVDMYLGPEELIDNEDFLFDVMNDSEEAEYTLYNCLIAHGYDLHTSPQT